MLLRNIVKFILCCLLIAPVSLFAQEEKLSHTRILWNEYVQWWYFNGFLHLQKETGDFNLPFFLLVGHQKQLNNNNIEDTLHYIYVDLADTPSMQSNWYVIPNSEQTLKKYFNPNLKKFMFNFPDQNLSISRNKNTFSLHFKGKTEIYHLTATLESSVNATFCGGFMKLSDRVPLLAYNYPVLRYSGTIIRNGIEYKVKQGSGYIDYNAWQLSWTAIVKRWLWINAFTKQQQITYFGLNTLNHNPHTFDVQNLAILDRSSKRLNNYCGETIKVNLNDNKESLGEITLTAGKYFHLVLAPLTQTNYTILNPIFTDDIYFDTLILTTGDASVPGFAFIEFFESK